MNMDEVAPMPNILKDKKLSASQQLIVGALINTVTDECDVLKGGVIFGNFWKNERSASPTEVALIGPLKSKPYPKKTTYNAFVKNID